MQTTTEASIADQFVMGISAQVAPVIMKTSRGGYVMMIPGKGLSGHSDLRDLCRCLTSELHMSFEEDSEPMPQVLQQDESRPEYDEPDGPPEPELARPVVSAPKGLQTLAALAFLITSLFISKGT